ncbi:MAG: hypothetical protein R2710_16135 [Acidimicrobiales bacterium]
MSSLAANSGSLIDHDPTSLIGTSAFKSMAPPSWPTRSSPPNSIGAAPPQGSTLPPSPPIPAGSHFDLAERLLTRRHRPDAPDIGARFDRASSIGALAALRRRHRSQRRSGDYFGPALPGEFFGTPKKLELLPTALDRETGRRLWVRSVELSGVGWTQRWATQWRVKCIFRRKRRLGRFMERRRR